MHMCVYHVSCEHAPRDARRDYQIILEQKFQEVMGRLTQVLGTELGFSWAASALNRGVPLQSLPEEF